MLVVGGIGLLSPSGLDPGMDLRILSCNEIHFFLAKPPSRGYCPFFTKGARELICALRYSCQLLFKRSCRKLSVGCIKAQIVCLGGNHSKLTVLKLSVSVRMSLSQTCGKQSESGLASHCESASKLDGKQLSFWQEWRTRPELALERKERASIRSHQAASHLSLLDNAINAKISNTLGDA